MNLAQFLQQVKQNRCRIFKGREQYLYNAVHEQGYDSPNVLEAIDISCPPAFKMKMRELIKSIPVQQKINLAQLANSSINKFVNQNFVRPNDLASLIRSIRFNIQQKVKQISDSYGMRIEYSYELEELISAIRLAHKQYQKVPNQQQLWKQFQSIIFQDSDKYEKEHYFHSLEENTIETPEKLRQQSIIYQTFLKKEKELYLFDVINNLGVQHELSQQAISDATYMAFRNDLEYLCKRIALRQPLANYEDVLKEVIHNLWSQYMVSKVEIIKLVQEIYQGKKEQVNRIIQLYCIENDQQLKARLTDLTSHLKEEFRHYQVSKIMQQCEYLLSLIQSQSRVDADDQVHQDIFINYFKQELSKLKTILNDEFLLQQAHSNEFIVAIYQQKQDQIGRISKLYGFQSQEIFINISEKINPILKDLTIQEQQQFKLKIYQFLNYMPKELNIKPSIEKSQKLKTILPNFINILSDNPSYY